MLVSKPLLRRSSGVTPAAAGPGSRRACHRTVPRAAPRPQLPPTADVVRVRIPELQWSIENVEGKRLSIGIYTHLATTFGGKLSKEAAEEGLRLYGEEVVHDAQNRPGAHPNIDLLFRVIREGTEHELRVERA